MGNRHIINNDTQNIVCLMIMHTIGLSIIYTAFKEAAWTYQKPNSSKGYIRKASESLAFVSGTGLELVLTAYGLDYDANVLRENFFSRFGDHSKIED